MSAALKVNLGYRDALSAIQFLTEVLGFEEMARYTAGAANIIAHAEYAWPEGGIVSLHSAEPGRHSVRDLSERAAQDPGYPAYSVHLDTINPEQVYERVLKAGATVIRELKKSPMGRGFVVADPEGLYWSVGTPILKLVRNEQGKWEPKGNE
jgi:uncharacterized glyoxalase superfamily protein PhnB